MDCGGWGSSHCGIVGVDGALCFQLRPVCLVSCVSLLSNEWVSGVEQATLRSGGGDANLRCCTAPWCYRHEARAHLSLPHAEVWKIRVPAEPMVSWLTSLRLSFIFPGLDRHAFYPVAEEIGLMRWPHSVPHHCLPINFNCILDIDGFWGRCGQQLSLQFYQQPITLYIPKHK